MKVTFFSTKLYDKDFFGRLNGTFGFDLVYYETHLGPHIVNVVENSDAVCAFVNDKLTAEVLGILANRGVKYIASPGFFYCRSTGRDCVYNVDEPVAPITGA